MKKIKEQVKDIASQYGLQIIYAFGSRAKEGLDMVEGRIEEISSRPSDLDIGVKPEKTPYGGRKGQDCHLIRRPL